MLGKGYKGTVSGGAPGRPSCRSSPPPFGNPPSKMPTRPWISGLTPLQAFDRFGKLPSHLHPYHCSGEACSLGP